MERRGAWNQPLTVLNGSVSPAQQQFLNSETLPHLQTITKATTTTWANQASHQQAVVPRPPNMRSRPMSAGGVPQTYVGRRSPPERSQINSSVTTLPQGNFTHRGK